MRYILIEHNWFVDSKGFKVHESNAKTFEEAQNESYSIIGKRSHGFRHVAVKILEIEESERLKYPSPRRVTFWDWLFGEKAIFENH